MGILLQLLLSQLIYRAITIDTDCNDGPCANSLSTTEKQAILDLHNELRDRVAGGGMSAEGHPPATDMNYLIWDEGLEAVAQTYAESCPGLNHNPDRNFQIKYQRDAQNTKWGTQNGKTMTSSWCGAPSWNSDVQETCIGVGENVAVRPDNYDLDSILAHIETGWWDEYTVWTYGPSSHGCNPSGSHNSCGHYTQMAWGDTRYIGCGYSNGCSSGGWPSIFVCNYFPMGNMNGDTTPPYTEADSTNTCSNCLSDRTECRSMYESTSITASAYSNQPYDALCDGGACPTMCAGDSWSAATCNECTPTPLNTDCNDGTIAMDDGRNVCSWSHAPTSSTDTPTTATPTAPTVDPTPSPTSPCIVLSSHTSSLFNGEWILGGIYNDELYYTKDGRYLKWIIGSSSTRWAITSSLESDLMYRYCSNVDLMTCTDHSWYYWTGSEFAVDVDATVSDCTAVPTADPTAGPTAGVSEPEFCDLIIDYRKIWTDKSRFNEETDSDKFLRRGTQKFIKKNPACGIVAEDAPELEFFYRFKYKPDKLRLLLYIHACCGRGKQFGSTYEVPETVGNYRDYQPNDVWYNHNQGALALQPGDEWTDVQQFGVKQYVVFALIGLLVIGCIAGAIYCVKHRKKAAKTSSPLPQRDLAQTIEMHTGKPSFPGPQSAPFQYRDRVATDGSTDGDNKYASRFIKHKESRDSATLNTPPMVLLGHDVVPSTSFETPARTETRTSSVGIAPPMMSSVEKEVDPEGEEQELDI